MASQANQFVDLDGVQANQLVTNIECTQQDVVGALRRMQERVRAMLAGNWQGGAAKNFGANSEAAYQDFDTAIRYLIETCELGKKHVAGFQTVDTDNA